MFFPSPLGAGFCPVARTLAPAAGRGAPLRHRIGSIDKDSADATGLVLHIRQCNHRSNDTRRQTTGNDGMSFFGDIGFSLRASLRWQTLGFVLLTVSVLTPLTATIDFRFGIQMAPGAFNVLAVSNDWTITLVALALAAAVFTPIWLFLYVSLNWDVFGRPLPVGFGQGILRLLKGVGLQVAIIVGVMAPPVAILGYAISSGSLPDSRFLAFLLNIGFFIGILALFCWLVISSLFLVCGTVYLGSFSPNRALILVRGRRWPLFGASIAAYAIIWLGAMISTSAGTGIVATAIFLLFHAVLVPWLIFVNRHFFAALDADERRSTGTFAYLT
ncbi:hypothetical protein L2U69_07360 [Zavarzinia compransoris]|uniref:hypothetical protein n=1 Tax=Zavarzinia marina TaxID=2911065 RepID=UPI001F2D381D|nr:hypothetical protein [Zavarzinia marina]MCF4165455.1 hypothetical protein [Zavarzinia marina]